MMQLPNSELWTLKVIAWKDWTWKLDLLCILWYKPNFFRIALTATHYSFLSSTIKKSTCRPKALFFAMINKLTIPPQHAISGSDELVNGFLQFYSDKVKSITDTIAKDWVIGSSLKIFSICFHLIVTTPAITVLIMKSNSTSYQLDPAPTVLLKMCFPYLTYHNHLINCIVVSAIVPAELKIAAVTAIFKKSGLDHLNINHYLPISNLPFLASILEKALASQLRSYLTTNGLFLTFPVWILAITQHSFYSVVNDILLSLDSRFINIPILLDLSSAFDTLCDDILLPHLSEIGIMGSDLSWLTSYLNNRRFLSLCKGTHPPLLLWHMVFLRVQFLVHYSLSSTCILLVTSYIFI